VTTNSKSKARRPPPKRPPAKASKSAGRRSLPLVGILIAVVAVLLLGAIIYNAVSKEDTTTTVEQNRPVTVEGTALPEFDHGLAQDPAIGTPAPTLSGQGFDGDKVALGGASDRPTLAVFVAHWCPHCQREVPLLVQWRADGTIPSDIDVVAVSTAVNPAYPNYPPSEWLADVGWEDPVMADDVDMSAAAAYGLSAYPYFVALDTDGNVVARDTGELTQDAVSQLVQQLQVA
jgi:thiol-disulfide isomerase/thioredoxin